MSERINLSNLRKKLEPQVARGFSYPVCLTAADTLALVEIAEATVDYLPDHWVPAGTDIGREQAARLRAALARIETA